VHQLSVLERGPPPALYESSMISHWDPPAPPQPARSETPAMACEDRLDDLRDQSILAPMEMAVPGLGEQLGETGKEMEK